MYKLHEYQMRAIDFIHEKKQVYLAIDMGLGKTAITLKAVENLEYPTVVLAPLRVANMTWPKEIKLWTPNSSYEVLYGKDKDLLCRLKRDLYIVSYSSLEWFLFVVSTGMFAPGKFNLVLDESTFVKSSSTKRFKLIKKLLKRATEYRICMSGTPMPNSYLDLWSQYFVLDDGKKLGESFVHFRAKYFFYSGPPMYISKIKYGSADLIKDKIKPITFRLDSKDYSSLPDIIHNKIELQLPEKNVTQYKKLEKDMLIQMDDVDFKAKSRVVLGLKLRQFLQGALYSNPKRTEYKTFHTEKISALKELLESVNTPILCPIQFRFEIEMIKKSLKNPNIPVIAGGVPFEHTMAYTEQWNNGDIPLLLCHPAALGHGVNLQSGGHTVCWFSLPWSFELFSQLNGRLHRQGQESTVTVHYIIFKDTIDEVVLKALKRKKAGLDDLLNSFKAYQNSLSV